MTNQATLAIVSALIGGVIALLSAIISGFFNIRTSKMQIEVARINAEKEVFLQQEKSRSEIDQKRILDIVEKLLEVHVTASRMAGEYSQTRSHFDWTDMIDRTEFRDNYREDCSKRRFSLLPWVEQVCSTSALLGFLFAPS